MPGLDGADLLGHYTGRPGRDRRGTGPWGPRGNTDSRRDERRCNQHEVNLT